MVFSHDTHDLKWYSHKYDANNISNCFYTRLQESLNKFCKLKTIQAMFFDLSTTMKQKTSLKINNISLNK